MRSLLGAFSWGLHRRASRVPWPRWLHLLPLQQSLRQVRILQFWQKIAMKIIPLNLWKIIFPLNVLLLTCYLRKNSLLSILCQLLIEFARLSISHTELLREESDTWTNLDTHSNIVKVSKDNSKIPRVLQCAVNWYSSDLYL